VTFKAQGFKSREMNTEDDGVDKEELSLIWVVYDSMWNLLWLLDNGRIKREDIFLSNEQLEDRGVKLGPRLTTVGLFDTLGLFGYIRETMRAMFDKHGDEKALVMAFSDIWNRREIRLASARSF
jgi:hypothetical protein